MPNAPPAPFLQEVEASFVSRQQDSDWPVGNSLLAQAGRVLEMTHRPFRLPTMPPSSEEAQRGDVFSLCRSGKVVLRRALPCALLALGSVISIISCTGLQRTTLAPPVIPGARFVGNQACLDCHTNITRAFAASPHARWRTSCTLHSRGGSAAPGQPARAGMGVSQRARIPPGPTHLHDAQRFGIIWALGERWTLDWLAGLGQGLAVIFSASRI